MDLYPNFYEDCTVQVKDHWKQCRDSLEACSLVSLQYKIRWPLNIVITEEHIAVYKELFQFILTVKWALYTINHLSFTGSVMMFQSRRSDRDWSLTKRW
jgi:hypothetical protein